MSSLQVQFHSVWSDGQSNTLVQKEFWNNTLQITLDVFL